MADIAISNASPVKVESTHELWAGAAITRGQPCYIDPTTGKALLTNATDAGTAICDGLAMSDAQENFPVTLLRRGLMDIGSSDELDALDFRASVHASNNAGALADAAGANPCVIGKVVPAFGSRPADRLIAVDL